ncbi:dihydrodipicolinate synthase family protein [Edaphobacter flagellatus]|uniref:dihydrodipicolinate synthase family protein n=1 Tax=Edaphobacter flagellatus TaxID=1933044 RepID=UPI0021B4288C|nr:dihydrodipicolinate synthase family protein [Edaphobacter flagellatus]
MLLEGLHLPVTTPFYSDGRLNLRKIEHNVDRYSRTPAAGIAVLSDVGEPEMLSDEETREALSAAISLAAETKVMLAGVSRASVAGALNLAEFAAKANYDAVLLKAPARRPEAERLLFLQAVSDRSALPVVMYSTNDAPLPVEVIAEMAAHSQVLGLADEDAAASRIAAVRAATASVSRQVTVTTVFAAATGRMLATQAGEGAATFIAAENLGGGAAVATAPPKPALKTRTKTVGFQILTANSAGMLAGLRAGAVGAMPAFAACAPQATYEVFAAWKDDDEPLADEKQARVAPAIQLIENELGVAGIRYASDLNGYFGGRPRLPGLPINGEAQRRVERVMQGVRN